MAVKEFTHLFCLDDKKSYSAEIKNRFSDSSRYNVIVSSSPSEIINSVKSSQAKKCFKVAVIPLPDKPDKRSAAESFAMSLLSESPDINIILMTHGDRPANLPFPFYSSVPANNNSIHRIHNSVKRLISEVALDSRRKRVRISSIVLAMTTLFSLGALYLAWYLSVARY